MVGKYIFDQTIPLKILALQVPSLITMASVFQEDAHEECRVEAGP